MGRGVGGHGGGWGGRLQFFLCFDRDCTRFLSCLFVFSQHFFLRIHTSRKINYLLMSECFCYITTVTLFIWEVTITPCVRRDPENKMDTILNHSDWCVTVSMGTLFFCILTSNFYFALSPPARVYMQMSVRENCSNVTHIPSRGWNNVLSGLMRWKSRPFALIVHVHRYCARNPCPKVMPYQPSSACTEEES